jgi:hypothetical protein
VNDSPAPNSSNSREDRSSRGRKREKAREVEWSDVNRREPTETDVNRKMARKRRYMDR